MSDATAYQRFRTRSLAEAVPTMNTGWEDVLFPYGLARAGRIFEDAELVDWAFRWFEHHDEGGYNESKEHKFLLSRQETRGHEINDYCGQWGGPLVFGELHRVRKDERLVAATRKICDGMLRQATRLDDGSFSHGAFDYGRETLWVDTLFYASPVLSEGFLLTGEERYAQEAIQQALLHAKWLRDPTTGGWFHDANPRTGVRTAAFWSRGNGWIILALADTLRLLPKDTPGWDEVLELYRSLATCMVRLQHASGLWRIVPEHPDAHLETSGSAMMLAGLANGLAAGWLDPTIGTAVVRGVREILTWIDQDGALKGAQRPAGLGTWDKHKLSTLDECTYATGLLWRMLADVHEAGLIDPRN